MDLKRHVEGPGPIGDICAHLNNLSLSERWETLASLSKKNQRTLFLKAEASSPIEASDLALEAGQVVVHRGKNSLPILRRFEKHMVRTEEGVIWGFNEGFTRRFVGPGYFRVRPCEGVEAQRSSWLVDYLQVPNKAPVEGWPVVRSNSRLLSYFVYRNTRDYLRKVSDGVLIGSAYKLMLGKERKLDSYFILMTASSSG